MKHDFDVVVIGGGHAGTEAASAAARMGSRTLLVTLKRSTIGAMSCNPAIGGLGKGHLVREIDALGGIMGEAADFAGIQFRLLNRSKGAAVRGPRTQSDRDLYQKEIQKRLNATENLEILEGEVSDLLVANGRVEGIVLSDGTEVAAPSVILTTGTFLRGVIFVGAEEAPGGRLGERPSSLLAERLDRLDLPMGRLKTGTPPRLRRDSIRWDCLDLQYGDPTPTMMSFMSYEPTQRQVPCGISHTNETTHEIIRENLHQSAAFNGIIEGTGPRYCPSIEDKVTRFADKTSHQVFLEPEGLTSELVYPNGLSTSLPVDIQGRYIRSIVGLEKAEIVQPGYSIEYDFVDPRCLESSLELSKLPGLFLAGQINGTTGYEEAAAQGIVAGINASSMVKGRASVVFGRENSYIGVMTDDLVTKGVTEPYRMFTSRAEFRLSLRADNADRRLTPLGHEIGLVEPKRFAAFERKTETLEKSRKILESSEFTPTQLVEHGIPAKENGVKRTGFDVLSMSIASWESIESLVPACASFASEVREALRADASYRHYEERQLRDVERLKKDENLLIPNEIDFEAVSGLSNEVRGKLAASNPRSIGQASRIEGMTPAALALILNHIRQIELKAS